MILLVKFAAGVAGLYVLVVVLVALAQDWLLFPRWAMGNGATALPHRPSGSHLKCPPGRSLSASIFPRKFGPPRNLPSSWGSGAMPGTPITSRFTSILSFPDRDIVAFHYRGYAPSTGRPSAAAILQDTLPIHDHVVATLSPNRIGAVGLSIGAGPAAHLACQRPIAGLILVTPFDSLKALAREHYPWAPVGLLLRHRMEIADALAASSAPVALIAAERDTIVPPRRTAPVRRSGGNIVLDRVIVDAGHNDLCDRADFKRAMRNAILAIETDGPGADLHQ